ncbi:predicted protein [Enterococcus casseliflavus EC30]|nr:predicted protein [Enterococcus casseliflavus EC30]EEV35999.1 predicted protein [Enterococcus casseliflavus EC10]
MNGGVTHGSLDTRAQKSVDLLVKNNVVIVLLMNFNTFIKWFVVLKSLFWRYFSYLKITKTFLYKNKNFFDRQNESVYIGYVVTTS